MIACLIVLPAARKAQHKESMLRSTGDIVCVSSVLTDTVRDTLYCVPHSWETVQPPSTGRVRAAQ